MYKHENVCIIHWKWSKDIIILLRDRHHGFFCHAIKNFTHTRTTRAQKKCKRSLAHKKCVIKFCWAMTAAAVVNSWALSIRLTVTHRKSEQNRSSSTVCARARNSIKQNAANFSNKIKIERTKTKSSHSFCSLVEIVCFAHATLQQKTCLQSRWQFAIDTNRLRQREKPKEKTLLNNVQSQTFSQLNTSSEFRIWLCSAHSIKIYMVTISVRHCQEEKRIKMANKI